MRLAHLILLCATLAATGAAAEPDTRLPEPVAQAARALGMPEDAISVWVQKLEAAEPLLAVNPDTPRNPASTMKLLTTFAALERLGPAFRWRTEVHLAQPPRDGAVAGDVWLRGTGDPYLVAEEYWKLAGALRKRGVERIDGDLVFDNSYFEVAAEDPGAFDNRPNRVYNLPPHPLLVNFNAVRFLVRPGADGRAVRVRADPPLPNLELDNRLRLRQAPCGGYQRGVALAMADPAERARVRLEGRFPAGCKRYALTRTVLRPESYAFGLFELYWQQLGGEITGRWRTGTVPEADGEPFLVHRSPPLAEVLRLVNKHSNNVMTRNLALTLGAHVYGAPATASKGLSAIRETLAERGISADGVLISNSAGLSRDSRLSARQLASVLKAAWHSPFMPEFVSSLAIAGLDGTLRQRLGGTAAQGHMHLKTGSLNDVSAVAGYAQSRSGERLLVVVLVNAAEAHRGLGEDFEDAVLEWVMRR